MNIHSKKELLSIIKISYQTLIRYEKLGFIQKPKGRIGQARVYSDREFTDIIEKIQDLIDNPEKYAHLNVKIRRSNAVQHNS